MKKVYIVYDEEVNIVGVMSDRFYKKETDLVNKLPTGYDVEEYVLANEIEEIVDDSKSDSFWELYDDVLGEEDEGLDYDYGIYDEI